MLSRILGIAHGAPSDSDPFPAHLGARGCSQRHPAAHRGIIITTSRHQCTQSHPAAHRCILTLYTISYSIQILYDTIQYDTVLCDTTLYDAILAMIYFTGSHSAFYSFVQRMGGCWSTGHGGCCCEGR